MSDTIVPTASTGRILVALNGDVTIAALQDLVAEAKRALTNHGGVTVDLSSVTYLDAAALQLLVSLKKTAVDRGISLEFTAAGAAVMRDATSLGMAAVFSTALQTTEAKPHA